MKPLASQRGVALITVLLAIALISIIGVEMSGRLQFQLRRTQASLLAQQANWIALGAERFAAQVLKQDFKDDPEHTHLGQHWASGEQLFPLDDGGMLSGEIRDLHGCFNLNALASDDAGDTANAADADSQQDKQLEMTQFQALLSSLEVDEFAAEQLAASLRDWLDSDDNETVGRGAEDAEYSSLTPAYLPANSLMVAVGELRAVSGSSMSIMQKLRPYICVRPQDSSMAINVNTVAEANLFEALFTPHLTLGAAEDLLSARPDNGWESVNEFLQESQLQGITISQQLKQQLQVRSRYFELKSVTEYEHVRFTMHAMLKRSEDDSWAVISRRFGG